MREFNDQPPPVPGFYLLLLYVALVGVALGIWLGKEAL